MGSGIRIGLLAVALSVAFYGCGTSTGGSASAPQSPAKVAGAPKEDQLNTIVLTDAAEKRLGISLAPIEMRRLQRTRTYGGEVVLPVGASLVVSAPVSGTLQAPRNQAIPKVGTTIAQGQPVFLLLPLLSPERSVLTPAERIRFAEAKNAVATSRIDAEGQVEQSHVQVEAAQIALDRADRLFKEKAGSARIVDEARAQLNLARKTFEAAQARKILVDNIKLDEEAGTLTPLAIEAPRKGIMRMEHAVAGEVVAAGAPLFEIMNCDPIWIKVPVYAGELDEIHAAQPAQLRSLSHAPSAKAVAAKPISAPPTATALASTVDLYYELSNADGSLKPGQRLQANLPLTGKTEQRGIPWSAVVQDINGGNWVYQNTAPHTYVRRRVQVKAVVDGWAVLENGPSAGTKIAVEGVAELFGTEFGFGK